jgi:ubiquinone/menaquinone biosynthesis C-methylase UbiE
MKNNSTSWHKVGSWYNKKVGNSGHYYHQHVVIPNSLKLLNLKNTDSVLDLACGQGVLARNIPKNLEYIGIDSAQSLIKFAKDQNNNPHVKYFLGDVTRPLPIQKNDFTVATIILALQNIDDPKKAVENASKHLTNNGRLLIVLNHPCFRIPRLSSWGIDEQKKLQYRRIDKYLSSQRIPITAHPGLKQKSAVTWSFHYSLSQYSQFLHQAGFLIKLIEEWSSDKESIGKASKMENRGRNEFPLFMALLCQKII